jgi:glycosyltransferase involved in cell wall biosynthesis
MEIGISCESLETDTLVGIGNTTLNLIHTHRRIYTNDTVVPIVKNGNGYRTGGVRVNPPLPKSLYQSYLSKNAKKIGFDVLHNSCGWLNGVKPTVPSMVTLYDLIPLTHPEYLTRPMRVYWRLFARRNLELADHIVAISEASKQAAVVHCGIDPEKITVAYPGVDPQFKPVYYTDVVERYGLQPGNYFIFVGSIDPRKNIAAVIKALALVAPGVPLAIASGGGWMTTTVTAAAQEYENVKFLGYVPTSALPALYSHARGMIWPSIIEGFGLPPLEAMACGCPVVTSNCSSLPEVVGNAALTVNPTDDFQIAAAAALLVDDDTLRAELSRKGIERAREFTWDRFTRGIHAGYKRAIECRT